MFYTCFYIMEKINLATILNKLLIINFFGLTQKSNKKSQEKTMLLLTL